MLIYPSRFSFNISLGQLAVDTQAAVTEYHSQAAYKQWIFISHCCRAWESTTKADLLSGEGLSLAPGCRLISLSSCAEGAGSFLGSPFCKGTDPLHEGPTLMTGSRPEGPTPSISH